MEALKKMSPEDRNKRIALGVLSVVAAGGALWCAYNYYRTRSSPPPAEAVEDVKPPAVSAGKSTADVTSVPHPPPAAKSTPVTTTKTVESASPSSDVAAIAAVPSTTTSAVPASSPDAPVTTSPAVTVASPAKPAEVSVAPLQAMSKSAMDAFRQQNWEEAARLFTECMVTFSEAATQQGRGAEYAQASLPTLYNNRSAAFEKLKEFTKCLDDIRTLLVIEPTHAKGRTRKVRVLKELGKLRAALAEMTILFQVEQMQNYPQANIPASARVTLDKDLYQELVEAVCQLEITNERKKAADRSGGHHRACPQDVRNWLAVFRSTSGLKKQYATGGAAAASAGDESNGPRKRSVLVAAAEEAEKNGAADLGAWVQASLDVCLWSLANENVDNIADDMERGARTLAAVPPPPVVSSAELAFHAGRLSDATGALMHLRHDLKNAESMYTAAVAYMDRAEELGGVEDSAFSLLRVESILKLAGCLLDQGSIDATIPLYERATELSTTTEEDGSIKEDGYVLIHRAQAWQLQQDNERALTDLTRAVEIEPELIPAYLRIAQLKVASATPSLSEAQEWVGKARQRTGGASDVSVICSEADILTLEGRYTDAQRKITRARRLDDASPTPLLSQLQLYTKAIEQQSTTGQEVDGIGSVSPADVMNLCEDILRREPQNVSALVNKLQMMMMTMTSPDDLQKVYTTFDEAISACPVGEEMDEIIKMRVGFQASIDAQAAMRGEQIE